MRTLLCQSWCLYCKMRSVQKRNFPSPHHPRFSPLGMLVVETGGGQEIKSIWLAPSSGPTEQLCFCLSYILSENLCQIEQLVLSQILRPLGGLNSPGFQGLLVGPTHLSLWHVSLWTPVELNQTRTLALMFSDLNKAFEGKLEVFQAHMLQMD